MSGTISLPYYPATNRTFGVFADIDGSKANTSIFQQRTLLLGQALNGAAAVIGSPVLITSLAQAASLFGLQSMLYDMVAQYRSQDSFGELWALPQADPTGSKAIGSLSYAGTATAAGTISHYVAGQLLVVPVNVGDTSIVLATRTIALAASYPTLAVALGTVANTSAVGLTAVHAGLLGNDIDLRANYLGSAGGENPVPGITVTYMAMTGGTGVHPELATQLSALAVQTYDYVCTPYTDTAALDALDAFLDEKVGRWSWQQMLFGGYFTAMRGTPGALATFGTARNGKHGSCLGVGDTPDPMWRVAADYTANVAASLTGDPNRPLQNMALGFKPPPLEKRFSRSIRNTMLYDGISTFTVVSGVVMLERACTFYQVNAAGAPDNAYLDVETLFGLAYLIRRWQNRMLTRFPRMKLVQDGATIPAGSNMVSPSTIRFETIAWYQEECDAGNAQDPAGFAKLILAQNAGNGLVKETLPFILVNQLRQIAAVAQFTKP